MRRVLRSLPAGMLGLVLVCTGASAQRPELSQATRQYVSVDESVVAITNVTVLDGTGAPARTGQTVVMRDGRIADLGPSSTVRVDPSARVIDGSGHTVIPGFVGLHDHLYYSAAGGRSAQMSYTGPRLYLAAGVTTIRTTGSESPYSDINMKRGVDEGRIPGPRIFITTPYLTGPGGGGSMSVVETADAARRFVAYWAEEGADWIKFYTNISREAMAAAIDEAHQRGMKATGHLCSVTFREAVELGIDDLAHGALTASDFIKDKKPDVCPPNQILLLDAAVNAESPVAKSLIDLMVKHGVSMTTTMAVIELFYQKRPVTDERALSLMAPGVREAYVAERARIEAAANYPLTPEGFQHALDFDRTFYRAGGILTQGVDPTGNGGALPGFGDQRGYELLIESGLTPPEAVKVVTLNGAKVLGIGDQTGSIEMGKVADLVLLRGDLTAHPDVIRNVVTVFKEGWGYDSSKLIDAVRGRVGIN